jgi:hypothetical protein
MSENSERRRIIVSLDQPKPVVPAAQKQRVAVATPSFLGQADNGPVKKGSIIKKILVVTGILLVLGVLAGGIAGYLWWTNLQRRPAYSLALLIDAARRDNKPQVEQLFDTNAVVDDFVLQVIDKAKERYGRGFPPQVVARATQLLTPILPAVKDRAKQEIPRNHSRKSASLHRRFRLGFLLPVWSEWLMCRRRVTKRSFKLRWKIVNLRLKCNASGNAGKLSKSKTKCWR